MDGQNHLERLKRGVNSWNQWRNKNPEFVPILERASIEGVNIHGADLRNANLRQADLRKSQGVSGALLGGADLTGAHMPEDYSESEQFAKINDAVKYAEKTFLVFLTGCVYIGLTIATTSDSSLLANSKSSSLPILQTEISIAGFYLAAPFLLLCSYIYLQIYLQRLWERLADAPAIFPDGRTVGRKVSPWFFNGLVYSHFLYLRDKSLPLTKFQFLISILFLVLLPVITLSAAWCRYLPRHDLLGTLVQVLIVLIGVGFGIFSYLVCRSTLRSEKVNIKKLVTWCVGASVLTGAVFLLVLYGAFNGIHQYFTLMLEVERGKISSDNLPNQSPNSGPLEKWVPRLLAYIQSPFPYLVDAQVSYPPENWDATNLGIVRGARLKGENLRYANASNAFLVNANLEGAILERTNLREADLRGANLENANLNYAYMIRTRFEGANLNTAELNDSYLLEAKLDNASLFGAHLRNARLHGAQLQNATLIGADLRKAMFQPAIMGWLELDQPGSKTNKMIVVALKAADLTGAKLQFAHLEGAHLEGVRGLTQEQINRACFDEKSLLPDGLVRPPPCPPHTEMKMLLENYHPK